MDIRHLPQRSRLTLLTAAAASMLSLAGCAGMGPGATGAQREVSAAGATLQAAQAQFRTCRQEVRDRPEFALLRPYLSDPMTGQYSMAQMTNERRPTAQEVAALASYADAVNGCVRTQLAELQSVRLDLAAIVSNEQAANSQVVAQLVERRITWSEFAKQSQRIISEGAAQIAAANQQWLAREKAENQAELNRRNALIMQFMQNQQAINAQTMNAMRPAPPNPSVHCTSLMTGPLVSTNCN